MNREKAFELLDKDRSAVDIILEPTKYGCRIKFELHLSKEEMEEFKKRCCEDRVRMKYNLKQEVKRLMNIFEDSFINRDFELVLEERRNLYVNLELVKTVKGLKINMVQWKTRACIKGDDEKILIKTRKRYNEFFKKDFSLEELELMYELLGNGVNYDLCEKFVDSDLNIEILKNYKEVK